MSTVTTPDGILVPQVGDTDGYVVQMAAAAGTVQTALARRQVHSYAVANATARGALSSTYTLVEGDTCDQADTDIQYRWSGSAWVSAAASSGSGLLTPTSVAGTGVSLSGSKVVAAAASAVSVNGVFTSAYSAYDVVINLTTSASTTLGVTLRLSGTDATTGYDKHMQRATASNSIQTLTSQTSWVPMSLSNAGSQIAKLHLFDPFTAIGTTGIYEWGTTANPMVGGSIAVANGVLLHQTLTAYDGFTITPGSGTVTGSVWIVGVA